MNAKVNNPIKLVAAIIGFQVLFLLNWLKLSPDVSLEKDENVSALLASIPNPSNHPEYLLAAASIRNAGKTFDILNVGVIEISFLVLALSIVILIQLVGSKKKHADAS